MALQNHLNLTRDFFKRHDIKILREMKGGNTLTLFYIILLAESTDHDGSLRFSEKQPYNEKMLSVITGMDEQTVHIALEILIKAGLVEHKEDGTYFMTKAQKMIGRNMETTEDEDEDATKEVECIRIGGRVERIPYKKVAELFNENCQSYPRVTKLSGRRREAIKARMREGYTLEDFEKAFQIAEASAFLKGNNNRGWAATFDWMLKENNIAKILDGNYSHSRGNYTNNKVAQDLDNFYNMVGNWAKEDEGE